MRNSKIEVPTPEQVVHRNIKTMSQLRKTIEESKGRDYTIANRITRNIGTLRSAYLQLIFVALWIFANIRVVPGLAPFDPFPFPTLGVLMSLEAILFAIFILISQNHSAEVNQRRDDLNLQITLLSEHELTRLIGLIDNLSVHLHMDEKDRDVDDLKQSIAPEELLSVIEREVEKTNHPNAPTKLPDKA